MPGPERHPGPGSRTAVRDGEVLRPVELSYRVAVDGRSAGTVQRSLRFVGSDLLRFSSTAVLGGSRVEQELDALRRSLVFVEARVRTTSGSGSTVRSYRRDGRELRAGGGGASRSPPLAMADSILVGELLELALWATPLEVGDDFLLSVARPDVGRVEEVPVRVVEATEITVPAGRFHVLRVEVGGTERQTLWVLEEAPHVPVRIRTGDGALVLELTGGLDP